MAQSRLEKIGTIFHRVTGLLKSGAMKIEDKPLWYDVYAAFPPKLEPKYDRTAPNIPLRQIFYEEDIIRAHYHKTTKTQENLNLKDTKYRTQCQNYIEIYNTLKTQGALDEQKIREVSFEMLKDKLPQSQSASTENVPVGEKLELTSETNEQKPSVNVKDIFKE